MLSTAERQRREDGIIRLRQEGCSNKQIAKSLGLPYSTITGELHRLIQEGKVAACRADPESIKESDLLIIQLRRQKHSNGEIAEKLGVSLATIIMRMHRLIETGRVKPRRKRKKGKNLQWHRLTLDSEPIQTLIALKRRDATPRLGALEKSLASLQNGQGKSLKQ